MFDPEAFENLKIQIRRRAQMDRRLLDDLRSDAKRLQSEVRAIKPRSTTAIAMVASDGGNNRLVFDPFFMEVVRVVDSYGKELFLDVISPTTDTDELSRAQFKANGEPATPLGRMMVDLGVQPQTLSALSHMIPEGLTVRQRPQEVSPSWVQVYRDLCEWAVLYERICFEKFATDTLIIRDGLLRSKLFRGDLLIRWRNRVEQAINRINQEDHRKVFLVGLAKHSKVLDRYNLAFAIENVLPPGEALYVPMPREMEAKAYKWQEWARGAEAEQGGGEAPKFVLGDMFLVRFGSRRGDPVWPVDIFSPQARFAPEIFGYLLADAQNGFPMPHYPRCLQRAHEYAQIVDFDLMVFQDQIYETVRGFLPRDRWATFDALRLVKDVAGERYS